MIEIGKEYRLANGWRYRLGIVDGGGDYPVKGWFESPQTPNEWEAISHTANGKFEAGFANSRDLVEVRPRKTREVWLNIYKDGSLGVHATRDGAVVAGGSHPEARKLITIEYEVGEGL